MADRPRSQFPLKRPEGSWTESFHETLELRVQTHFLASEDCELEAHLKAIQSQSREIIEPPTIEDKVSWAIESFSAYQSPVSGGIVPVSKQ